MFFVLKNKKQYSKRVWEKGWFLFLVFSMFLRGLFSKNKKKVVLIVFFTVQGRVVLRVLFSCFFVFPFMWFLLQQQEMKDERMKMAAMLANYGGLGMSEWLWVWKVSTTVQCFEGQGHRWRCCKRRCVVQRVRLWDSQIPISNHQSCPPWKLKKKNNNYSRLTQLLLPSNPIKMRDQRMKASLPRYNWRTVGASILVDGDSSSSMPGLDKIPSPTPVTLDCDWDLGESFRFGDFLMVIGIGRTIFGKLVILYFIMQHQI